MIIKCIKAIYKESHKKNFASYLIYGREQYEGYDFRKGDIIDTEILECISQNAESHSLVLNESFVNADTYKNRFRAMYSHSCILKLRPIYDFINVQEKKEFLEYNLSLKSIPLVWFNNKNQEDPLLNSLPDLYIDVYYKNFKQLTEGVKTIDIFEKK